VLLLLLLQVSWDFHNAAKHGITLLLQQVEQLTFTFEYSYYHKLEEGLAGLPAADGWSWQEWAACLSDPLSYKLPELKEAARQLYVVKSGTKAELILRLLGAFGLKAPSKAPPQLLRAMALERMGFEPWRGSENVRKSRMTLFTLCNWCERPGLAPGIRQQITAVTRGMTLQQLTSDRSAVAWRRLLVSTGVESQAQLLQLVDRAERTHREVLSALERAARERAALEGQDRDVVAGEAQGEAAHVAAQAAAAAQQGGAIAAEVQGQEAQEAA
jgi:hypothetical protein